jgi:NADP-dependent 3-hydroxy acid dehydrogenase YdfG
MSDAPVFVITGASTGIGAATARRAHEAGHRLVLAARSEDKLQALADELGGGEDRVRVVATDVTDNAQVEALIAAATAAFGRVDVVFANAGFGSKPGFEGGDVDHWREMVLTNVYGAAITARAAIPALKATRGHFLLTGSTAGRIAVPGSLYSSTKWAVSGMAESLRQELAESGVRVTVIEPAKTDTPFFDTRPETAAEPDDIARAVLYAVTQPPEINVDVLRVRAVAQA